MLKHLYLFLFNFNNGIIAKGSYTACSTFSYSLIDSGFSKKIKVIAGIIAIDLVIKDLINFVKRSFIKPSIINWPDNIPEHVELCPADSNPIAQMYFPDYPKALIDFI